MKVRVDPEICQGHTLCAMTAPRVFQLHEEDGHAYVISANVAEDQEGLVKAAARACPEQAIILSVHAAAD